MCDPMTIGAGVTSAISSLASPAAVASGALGLGGALLQNQGMQQAQNAQMAAASAEQWRQRGFADRQFSAAEDARREFAPEAVQQGQQEAAARRSAAYAQTVAPSDTTPLPGPAGGSGAVEALMAGRRDQNRVLLEGEGQRRAAAEAWADALFGRSVAAGRQAERGGLDRGFARGSLGALPAEQRAAQFRGQGLRTAGDLMTLGSAVAAPLVARAAPTWAGIFGAGGQAANAAGAPARM